MHALRAARDQAVAVRSRALLLGPLVGAIVLSTLCFFAGPPADPSRPVGDVISQAHFEILVVAGMFCLVVLYGLAEAAELLC